MQKPGPQMIGRTQKERMSPRRSWTATPGFFIFENALDRPVVLLVRRREGITHGSLSIPFSAVDHRNLRCRRSYRGNDLTPAWRCRRLDSLITEPRGSGILFYSRTSPDFSIDRPDDRERTWRMASEEYASCCVY